MKYLAWLLKAAIFLTVFAFALNNLDDVRLNLLFGAHWNAPLVLVLLATLALGVFLGIAVMLPLWLKARRLAAQAEATPTAPTTVRDDTPDTLPHGI